MDEQDNVTIVVLAQETIEEEIRRALGGSRMTIHYVRLIQEVAALRQQGLEVQVFLLPDTLIGNDWWELWGEIMLFERQPEIIVYSRAPTFELWTGVLDLGGVDVVTVPIQEQEIKIAVSSALEDFYQRILGDSKERS